MAAHRVSIGDRPAAGWEAGFLMFAKKGMKDPSQVCADFPNEPAKPEKRRRSGIS
jgi:hypothetical protein